jgi:hypothetical protein
VSSADTDPTTGIAVVQYSDDHFEGVDTVNGASLWTLDAAVVHNTDFRLEGVGDGYVSGHTKTGSVTLDVRTGKQLWLGERTAGAPLGVVSGGRLLTCEGQTSENFPDAALVSLSISATPIGLDVNTPIYVTSPSDGGGSRATTRSSATASSTPRR